MKIIINTPSTFIASGRSVFGECSMTLQGSADSSGVRTLDYFKKKARGEILPVNPYSRYSEEYRVVNGSMSSHHRSGGGYSMSGNIPLHTHLKGIVPVMGQVPSPLTYDVSQFNTLAITAIADARQELLDSMTFLAELDKTREMFATLVNRYTQRALIVDKRARVAWKTWKRKGLAPTSSTNAAAVFASTWLEYRYGWTPLSFEITAMYKQLLELDALTHRVRGSASTEVETPLSSLAYNGASFKVPGLSSNGGWLWNIVRSTKRHAFISSKCILELLTSFRCTVDPIQTLHEVIPYSWLFDWFVNIGECIKAFSPFQQGKVKACSLSVSSSGILRFESLKPADDLYVKLDTFTPGSFELRKTQKTRIAASPSFELSLRCELNLRRIVDAFSLILIRMATHLRLIPRESLSNWRHTYV